MKRILPLILFLILLFTSCDANTNNSVDNLPDTSIKEETPDSSPEDNNSSDSSEDNETDNTQNEESKAHDYQPQVTSPTCNSEGYTTYVCTICGDYYVADYVDAIEHRYISVVTPPTCSDYGYTTHTCYGCGDSYVSDQVDTTGHKYSSHVTVPTCTSDGYTTYTCDCGYAYVGDTVKTSGHTEVTVPGKAATCTSTGLTDGTKCSACGIITKNQTEIAIKDHDYKTDVTVSTCTNVGYTTYTCKTCGYSYVSGEVSALGHTEVTVPGKAATCTSTGLSDGAKCSVCGIITKNQSVIPATDHSYKAAVTVATCTAGGYTTYNCTACGDTYVSDKTAAKGHTEVTIPGKSATCIASGLTDGKKCSVCGVITKNQTEIAEKGHSYKTEVVAPTCTSAGYTVYTCSVCGDTYTGDKVAAKGHTEVTISAVSATCTATGLTAGKKCSVCGTVTVEQKIVDIKGHTPGASATCTTDQTCTVCKVTITVATGHTWKDATTSAPKTCTTCGATEGEKLPSSSTSSYGTLYVNYINVGQGDSILIKVGDCDILIDGGPTSSASSVSSYLSSKGVDDIELMINTHPHEDHCGGLTTVLNNFVVEEVWVSPQTATSSAYNKFKTAVSSEGLSMKTPSVGTVYTYEFLTITVIYAGAGASNANDSSLVVMLEYGSFKFLFTGDISTTVESKLVSSGADLSCDVLKVPHHGSAGSSSASFLKATGAGYSVICVGSGNQYGHPTSDALGRLSSAGISVYRTDTSGHIVFSTNGATLYLPGGGTDSSGSGSSSSGSSGTSGSYIGNSETKVYHLPTCSYLPAASKQVVLSSTSGYTPCGHCIKGSSGTTYIANSESKVYHLSTCSYLPAASKQVVITNTAGYTPCGHCIKGSSGTTYIANSESKVYHLSTCSYLPAASKQVVITNTTGYTPCGHCIKSSSTTKTYIANSESKVYHLPTCSYLPATSKQVAITSTAGYTPCGHCIK